MGAERQSVAVFPVHRGPPPRVLVLHRTPERGGGWQPVTGSVHDDEDHEAAARREVAEETGLVVDAVEPLGVGATFTGYDGHHYRERTFVAVVATTDVVLSAEHDDARFVTVEEALGYLGWAENRAALRRLARAHLNTHPG